MSRKKILLPLTKRYTHRQALALSGLRISHSFPPSSASYLPWPSAARRIILFSASRTSRVVSSFPSGSGRTKSGSDFTHASASAIDTRAIPLKRPAPNAARRCPPTSEVIRQFEERKEFLFFEGPNIERFIVRLIGLPAGVNDACPLECQGADGAVMRLPSRALTPIELIHPGHLNPFVAGRLRVLWPAPHFS
jgi:hypothetical protein